MTTLPVSVHVSKPVSVKFNVVLRIERGELGLKAAWLMHNDDGLKVPSKSDAHAKAAVYYCGLNPEFLQTGATQLQCKHARPEDE